MNHIDLKKSLETSEHFVARAGNDAYFDWGVILTLSCIVAAVFVGFSTKLFLSVNAGNSAGGVVGSSVGSSGSGSATGAGGSGGSAGQAHVDTSDLNNLISIFQSKSAQAPVFVATYPGPSDPAVPVRSVPTTNLIVPVKSTATSTTAATATTTTTTTTTGKSSTKNSSVKSVSK